MVNRSQVILLVDRAVSFSIRNPKSKGCRIRIKIQGLPFTSDKSSAYYKFTYTTDAVVSKSLGFYIGCTINEQL